MLNQNIFPQGIQSEETFGHSAAIWQSANYAEKWYSDALQEAKHEGPDARRREIIFSAAFVESYFYEWTRRLVGVEIVGRFFINSEKKLTHKICALLKALGKKGYIPSGTQVDLSELGNLLAYRNGLMHGGASRPMKAKQAQKERPKPTPKDLGKLAPGYALNIVQQIVDSLHQQTQQPLPDYLIKK